MDGILILDKPAGITSHTLVAQVRRALNTKKVGHTGTLDPMATGVMVVCVGSALRLAEYITAHTKTYRVVARLGETSDTGDITGALTPRITRALPFTEKQLEEVLSTFVGKQLQTPPRYSALKIGGVPAHRRARQGEDFTMAAREITIAKITFIRFAWPELEFKVSCSAGTYIRSLVEDIGEKLGCGGCMASLRRTRVGKFTLREAITPEEITSESLISPLRVLENFPRVRVTPPEVSDVLHGRALATTMRDIPATQPILLTLKDQIIAVAFYDSTTHMLRPRKVML